MDLPPPSTWELPGHLRFFHGVYVGDVVKTLTKRKGESAAAFKARQRARRKWEEGELRACHAWAHGEGGKIAIPHRHVV